MTLYKELPNFLDPENQNLKYKKIVDGLKTDLESYLEDKKRPHTLKEYYYPDDGVLVSLLQMVRLKDQSDKALNFLKFILEKKLSTSLMISANKNEPLIKWSHNKTIASFIIKDLSKKWTFTTALPQNKQRLLKAIYLLSNKIVIND